MQILDHFEQKSQDWFDARMGRVTMSNAKVLKTDGKGKESYILDLVAERLSGEPIDGYYNADMERGNFLEAPGLQAFSELTGHKVRTVGFVLHDDERIGCSPDALLIDGDAGVEIKCPKPRRHLQNIFGDGMREYAPQAQGGMWVCERKYWFIVSFCPWVKQRPVFTQLVERDGDYIKALAASSVDAANKVDDYVQRAMTNDLPLSVFATAEKARVLWENALAESSEVKL